MKPEGQMVMLQGADSALPMTAVRSVAVLINDPPASTPPVTTGELAASRGVPLATASVAKKQGLADAVIAEECRAIAELHHMLGPPSASNL